VGGVRRGLLHSFGDYLEARFPWQRRDARRPRLVAPEAVHAFVQETRLPAPNGRLGRVRTPHDLDGATAICRRQHDLGAPDHLAGGVSVGEQCLKLRSVGGAQIQADVIASHAANMTRTITKGNRPLGGEH